MRRTWALLSSTIVLAFAAGCSSDPADGSGPNANSGGTGGSGTGGSSGSSGSSGTGNPGGSSGTSTTGGASGSGGGSGASGSNSGGTGNVSSAGSSSTGDCTTTEILPTVVRRLTRFEYANTVRDLLNVDPAPAAVLPADEVSNGFDNESSALTVSSLHAEKYVLASEELAKAAVANLAALSGCDSAGDDACAQAFAKSFGRRAFRRPTTPADETALMTAYNAGKANGGYARGIEVMIRAALQSPDFIYRLEITPPANANAALVPLSQFELATRLSYMIWATTPTDALLDDAQNGQLGSKEQVAAKAREMLADPKAKIGLSNFFNQWSGVTRLAIMTKNTTLFPSFNEDMRAAMTKELPAFVEHVVFNGDHSLHSLLTSPMAFVSGPLGAVYGVTGAPTTATPTGVTLAEVQGRSGLLTQAGFLAVQGHPDQTSPVLRGKFVRAMMLCDPPQPPPDNVDTTLPTVDEGATARERFSAHSEAPSCQGCHIAMDPIGFAFENFDAMGQYRTLDNGQPIDATGEIFDPEDVNLGGQFNGVRELGEKLAASPQVTDCLATQWFRYSSGRLEAGTDACSLGTIRNAFSTTNGDLIELVVAMTQADDFWYRAPVTQ